MEDLELQCGQRATLGRGATGMAAVRCGRSGVRRGDPAQWRAVSLARRRGSQTGAQHAASGRTEVGSKQAIRSDSIISAKIE
ncbi:hypothetical protein GQ55_1G323100 [Panicum hallii var. hallii]|uniref:Uncharacterized protein n=1 Tax=Panicum hallii var. hallii TaxID=1504633 RepID=A0A2T7F9U7_9POAL|nr:hypothetical protein GQ55_1G323100 [Panicum hallii var. hallii]